MVKIICEIDPKYEKYLLTSKTTGKKKLYGKLTKAVYKTGRPENLEGMTCRTNTQTENNVRENNFSLAL